LKALEGLNYMAQRDLHPSQTAKTKDVIKGAIFGLFSAGLLKNATFDKIGEASWGEAAIGSLSALFWAIIAGDDSEVDRLLDKIAKACR